MIVKFIWVWCIIKRIMRGVLVFSCCHFYFLFEKLLARVHMPQRIGDVCVIKEVCDLLVAKLVIHRLDRYANLFHMLHRV
jgi:hypothetical protein